MELISEGTSEEEVVRWRQEFKVFACSERMHRLRLFMIIMTFQHTNEVNLMTFCDFYHDLQEPCSSTDKQFTHVINTCKMLHTSDFPNMSCNTQRITSYILAVIFSFIRIMQSIWQGCICHISNDGQWSEAAKFSLKK